MSYNNQPTTKEIPIAGIIGTEASDSEVKRLRSTHPVYDEFYKTWQMAEEFYEGGDRVLCNKHIFRHHREEQKDYEERVKRADYENYVALVVNFFSCFIFSESIARDGGSNSEFYNKFRLNVDRRGNDIDQFMRRVCTLYQLYGMVYLLVDSPRVDKTILTKAQEEARGIRPYWVLINPDEILDWDKDEFGKFTYVKRCQKVFKRKKGYPVLTEKYTEWYPDRIVISEVEISEEGKEPQVTVTEELPNKLGEIPIFASLYEESKTCSNMGESFVKDIVRIARSSLNKCSLIDEFAYKQCFTFLTVQTSGLLATQSEDQGEYGTSNLWEYPVGAEKPSYVAPPIDPATFLQTERDHKRNVIFEIASQNLQSMFNNGEKSSGFSQSQSFAKTVPFIAQRGDSLESIETQAMKLTMRYLRKEWDGTIKYKDRYEQTNVMDAITQLQSTFKDLAMPSKTFVKSELKRVVREVDGKLSPADMDKIITEIEAVIDDEEKFKEWQMQVMAKNGSPAAQNKPKTSGTLQEVQKEAKLPNTRATKPLPSNTK